MVAVDGRGVPVVSVDSMVARPISREQLQRTPGARQESLFRLGWVSAPAGTPRRSGDWQPVVLGGEDAPLVERLRASGARPEVHVDLESLREAVDGPGREAPAMALLDCTGGQVDGVAPAGVGGEGEAVGPGEARPGGVVSAVHNAVSGALEVVQGWLADERFAASRLVVLTRGAVAVRPGEELQGLAQAGVWGLVRAAQSEHPGRLTLVDLDDGESSPAAIEAAALATDETQLAVRGGEVLAPRLERVASPAGGDPHEGDERKGEEAREGRIEGTVLITGGTGGLGAQVARHLVAEHGARRVLLASRRGREAPGAAELEAELVQAGADVRIEACDVTARDELERLVESVSEESPLRMVVHAAGVLDDGVIESLTPQRVEGVLAPKVAGAWYLHELTERLELSAFVLFSSAAGVFGGPGQGSYAAANTFLDALAAYRRARELPATSMAWGLWEQEDGMAGSLGAADRSRAARAGVIALSAEQGLELFDRGRGLEEALLLAVQLDAAALRAQAGMGWVPPLLRGLVRVPLRSPTAPAGGSLAQRLEGVPAEQREDTVLELVRAEVAAVLGHASAEAVEAQRPFNELGFDSLAATELRNRLLAITGLQLPATIVFEAETPAALARELLARVAGLEADGEGGGEPAGALPGEAQPSTFGALLRQAHERGMVEEFMGLLASASTFRPTFDAPPDRTEAPEPVRLCRGEAAPHLVCLPSALATSSPYQYAKFAGEFRGVRDVTVLPLPGFAGEERLPANVRVALEAQAEAVQRLVADAPFVLVGHSTGGALAYAVAAQLESVGVTPAGVVLIDTYSFASGAFSEAVREAIGGMLALEGGFVPIGDRSLTAMGAYGRLLAEWEPREISASTLLIQASEPMSGVSADGEWRSSWDFAHSSVEVAGNHFTMMEDHVAETARALQEWLSSTLVGLEVS
jgi:thioesterase domain-containing protein/NADP-dependent 3-hydroxy acid dehydrogenase YdfG/acyl carrier protein